MESAESKENVNVLGKHGLQHPSFAEHAPLCSTPERLSQRRDSNTTPLAREADCERLNQRVAELEAELDKVRHMLYAAEDIINEQRDALATPKPTESVAKSSWKSDISHALNVAVFIGLCICVSKVAGRSFTRTTA